MDLFDTYRKMFATRNPDELVVWWYCGFVIRKHEGLGEIPQGQAETIMVYRTRDVDAATFTIDWTEVGVFRDLITGEQRTGWFNPFTNLLMPAPTAFVDGPATFTVSRAGDGIAISLVQHNARIDGVQLDVSVNAASLGLKQTETKSRTFHRPDGTLPPLDGPDTTHIDTVLSIWSDRAAAENPSTTNVASDGFYTSGSRSTDPGTGSWASTIVRGAMKKGRVDEKINPVAWQRLQKQYPDFFTGDRIDPEWATP